MAICNTIVGIPKGCDDNNIGGIREIYITDQEDVTSLVVDSANHIITGITASGFEVFTFNRNVGNFVTEETKDLLVGSNTVKGTITLTLNRREGSKSRALSILGEVETTLVVVVQVIGCADFETFLKEQGMKLLQLSISGGVIMAVAKGLNLF
jgi:hypothetical protein